MISKNSQRNKKSIYDSMTTEELCQILRDDAEYTDDNQMDAEQLLQIMEVINERREQKNSGGDVKKSIEIFKKYYLSDNVPPPAPVRKPTRWKRGLVAAAAALAVLIGGLTIPDASGKSALQHIAQWSDDFFWFDEPQQNKNPDGTFPSDTGERVVWKELRDLLTEHGITSVLLPNWMPDGYVLYDVDVSGEGKYAVFSSGYLKGEKLLYFSVNAYNPDSVSLISKNPRSVNLYQYNGVDFYIIGNMERLIIVWIHDGYECCFSGNLTLSDVTKMIESMTKG